MTFRTQNQLQGSRPMPVRWKALSWHLRITRLSPLSCSASSPDCRQLLGTPGVVCLWRRGSKPAYLFSESAWACSADFQSAVSPNFIRQSVESLPRAGVSLGLAECNSAIQHSITLRYDGALNSYKRAALRTDEGRAGSDNHSFFPRFGPTTH